MVEDKLHCGYYTQTENKMCEECGVQIGDYTIYQGKTRCVGCWVEFEANLDKSIEDDKKI